MAEFSSESSDELSGSDEPNANGDVDLGYLEERDFETAERAQAVLHALKAAAARLEPPAFYEFVQDIEAGMLSRRRGPDPLRAIIRSDPELSVLYEQERLRRKYKGSGS